MRNQISVRGLDAETDRHLRELARRLGISRNRAAVMLLRKGAGLREDNAGPEVVGDALDSFFGSWSPDEEARLLKSIRELGQVDPELWR